MTSQGNVAAKTSQFVQNEFDTTSIFRGSVAAAGPGVFLCIRETVFTQTCADTKSPCQLKFSSTIDFKLFHRNFAAID